MKFLTQEQLEKLNTKRLLSYKKTLLKFSETLKDSWSEMISKESPEWKENYQLVKAILATKEHVNRS